jgi:hypothetical protein
MPTFLSANAPVALQVQSHGIATDHPTSDALAVFKWPSSSGRDSVVGNSANGQSFDGDIAVVGLRERVVDALPPVIVRPATATVFPVPTFLSANVPLPLAVLSDRSDISRKNADECGAPVLSVALVAWVTPAGGGVPVVGGTSVNGQTVVASRGRKRGVAKTGAHTCLDARIDPSEARAGECRHTAAVRRPRSNRTAVEREMMVLLADRRSAGRLRQWGRESDAFRRVRSVDGTDDQGRGRAPTVTVVEPVAAPYVELPEKLATTGYTPEWMERSLQAPALPPPPGHVRALATPLMKS